MLYLYCSEGYKYVHYFILFYIGMNSVNDQTDHLNVLTQMFPNLEKTVFVSVSMYLNHKYDFM